MRCPKEVTKLKELISKLNASLIIQLRILFLFLQNDTLTRTSTFETTNKSEIINKPELFITYDNFFH